jgi:hypothetical protein
MCRPPRCTAQADRATGSRSATHAYVCARVDVFWSLSTLCSRVRHTRPLAPQALGAGTLVIACSTHARFHCRVTVLKLRLRHVAHEIPTAQRIGSRKLSPRRSRCAPRMVDTLDARTCTSASDGEGETRGFAPRTRGLCACQTEVSLRHRSATLSFSAAVGCKVGTDQKDARGRGPIGVRYRGPRADSEHRHAHETHRAGCSKRRGARVLAPRTVAFVVPPDREPGTVDRATRALFCSARGPQRIS